MRRFTAILVAVICCYLSFFPQKLTAQEDHYGNVDFETSCNKNAQGFFEDGLALLHHMMYEQSRKLFTNAVEVDSDCAIAYWGISMTQLRPLWAPPTEKEFETGLDAIKKAVSVGTPDSREMRYIESLHTYYKTASEMTFQKGVRAWEKELKALHEAYPDDIDAGAFYALAHIATAPRDDKTLSHQKKAGALLESLLGKAPQHPGLFHYTIHAYDNPALAEQAIKVANRYDKLAPNVPHALHMPSHIFVRMGMWPEVIDWNRRSADAALEQSDANYTSLHHVHALDYLVYAYLQRGEYDKAKKTVDEILKVKNYQPHPASAYGISAAMARNPLEGKKWETAKDLPVRVHNEYPWNDYPEHEAITYWAKGLGAARSGDLQFARKSVNKLDELHQRTVDKGENYWALLVEVKKKTIEAWIDFEEGNKEKALALMKEAAELEDSVDKHPITPSEVLPARELYGDMLVLEERYKNAIEAYETALEISPNRYNSLYGAGKAAEKQGDLKKAKQFYKKLIEITSDTATERPELEEIRQFLAANG